MKSEYPQFCDKFVNTFDSRERERAISKEFMYSFVSVLHHDDDLGAGADQVHGPTHPLHQFVRNYPVRDVPPFTDLHRPQKSQVQLLSSDHRERLARRKVAPSYRIYSYIHMFI